jgi:hypothetical protein
MIYNSSSWIRIKKFRNFRKRFKISKHRNKRYNLPLIIKRIQYSKSNLRMPIE